FRSRIKSSSYRNCALALKLQIPDSTAEKQKYATDDCPFIFWNAGEWSHRGQALARRRQALEEVQGSRRASRQGMLFRAARRPGCHRILRAAPPGIASGVAEKALSRRPPAARLGKENAADAGRCGAATRTGARGVQPRLYRWVRRNIQPSNSSGHRHHGRFRPLTRPPPRYTQSGG